jgi:hypothetical protein
MSRLPLSMSRLPLSMSRLSTARQLPWFTVVRFYERRGVWRRLTGATHGVDASAFPIFFMSNLREPSVAATPTARSVPSTARRSRQFLRRNL